MAKTHMDKLCTKHKITVTAFPSTKPSRWSTQARGWFYVLHFDGRHLAGDFWQGMAYKKPPTAGDIVAALVSDASRYESSDGDLDTFAADFGDRETQEISKTIAAFESCKKAAADLRVLFFAYPAVLGALRDAEH